MQNTSPCPSALSSESSTNSDQNSSSLASRENLNLSLSTTRAPPSPPRFIGPLPYIDPEYMRRVDSILRSFPVNTDPAAVYTALKARLGISRSKSLSSTSTPPPSVGNTLPQEGPSRPNGKETTPSTDRPLPPLEVISAGEDNGRGEASFLLSTAVLRRREAEWNLFSTIEDDLVPGGVRRGTVDEFLKEADVLRHHIDAKKQAVGAVTEESKADKNAPPQAGRGQKQ